MLHGLYFLEIAASLQVFHEDLAAGHGVHALVLLGNIFIHMTVVGHYINNRKIMPESHLEVVGVVGRGDLYNAGSELNVDIVVGHDGNLFVHDGEDEVLADDVLVALILRVDCHGGVAEHGLGTGGGKDQVTGAVGEGVLQMPEAAVLLLVLDLGVGDGGAAVGAPVDDALTAVDETFLVEVAEDLPDSLGTALVQREALPLPVTGRAHLLELLDDAAAVLGLPLPGALEELLPAEILLGDSLFAEGLDDLCLGGDGRVVRTGDPQRVIALHAVVADEDVLKCIVKGVAHVELPGDVWGRNDDGVGSLGLVKVSVEIISLEPEVIDAVFKLGGVVSGGKVVRHAFSS